MDWAEELKISIRKTTARKGRRSKSRDVLKDSTAPPSTSKTNSSAFSSTSKSNNDLSVELNVDLQQTTSSGNSNNVSSALGAKIMAGDAAVGTSMEKKRPPMLKRISGGWADSALSAKLRSKKSSFDDDRFVRKTSADISPTDTIPKIPDLDDLNEDLYLNEDADPPTLAAANHLPFLDELNSDLLSQNAFSAIENVDLSILTKWLQPQETLDEPDEVWEWDKLFIDVIAEINSENPLESKFKNLDLKGGSDESSSPRKVT